MDFCSIERKTFNIIIDEDEDDMETRKFPSPLSPPTHNKDCTESKSNQFQTNIRKFSWIFQTKDEDSSSLISSRDE